jgi:Fe2+ transport system protein B
MHPLIRPFGLSGRDLVRVMMGYGCNVPAIISTRACSSCTRATCISTIALGSACSYQLGATIGVFAAIKRPELLWPYLLVLTVTTLLYSRFTSAPASRANLSHPPLEGRSFLVWPHETAVWREARGTLTQFLGQALPIFFVITTTASLLDWLGVISALAALFGPAMTLFRLPTEAALPILFASIRKDGILLFADEQLAMALTPLQILTGVYLAGALFPCLVTVSTIAREQSWRFAMRLLFQQSSAAVIFSLLLAWGGTCIGA